MNQTYDIMENREESGQRLRFRKKYEAPFCEAGQTDYEVLVDGVPDLKADDGSVWKAKAIWDLTAEGVPAIEEEYLGENPASSGAGMP